MLKKLDDIKKRYDFLSEKLADSEVIADMGTWQKYSKEQSDLTETVEKYDEYLDTERQMTDAFALAETETDAEMKKMLLDEGYDCKEKLAVLLNDLKILLLPKDKNDERSCILEIRAGTGGEEAALFAGELCRMYQNYCAAHRKWKATTRISVLIFSIREGQAVKTSTRLPLRCVLRTSRRGLW